MKTLIVGLNPAWQNTLVFDSIEQDAVNRAVGSSQIASGKGINALRAFLRCGGDDIGLLQFAGGVTGRVIEEYVNSLGVNSLAVRTEAETRICTTVIDRKAETVTELIGKWSAQVSVSEVKEMEARVESLDSVEAVLISGSVPGGVPESMYGTILNKVSGQTISIVDSCKNIDDFLKDRSINILKINRHELLEITGEGELAVSVAKLFSLYELEVLMLTDGANDGHLFTEDCHIRFKLPQVEVINSIGAGDCCAGVLLHELSGLRQQFRDFSGKLLNHITLDELSGVFAKSLAAATASCLKTVPGDFSVADSLKLGKELRVS